MRFISLPLGIVVCLLNACTSDNSTTSAKTNSTTNSKENSAPSASSTSQQTPISYAHSVVLKSAALNQDRTINVFLPPSYATSTAQYPVIYLLDGGAHEDFHHITGIVQVLTANLGMPEHIVVGMANVDRRHDYAHPSSVKADLEDSPTSGGSAKYRDFLSSELLPFIENNYRANQQQTLIGESLAGLFVVETLLKQPELFDTYIAFSPSLWWDAQSLAMQSAQLLKANPTSTATVYLSIGNEGEEMQQGMDKLIAALQSDAPKTVQWHYQPMQEESHASIFHPGAYRALRFLFADEDKRPN